MSTPSVLIQIVQLVITVVIGVAPVAPDVRNYILVTTSLLATAGTARIHRNDLQRSLSSFRLGRVAPACGSDIAATRVGEPFMPGIVRADSSI